MKHYLSLPALLLLAQLSWAQHEHHRQGAASGEPAEPAAWTVHDYVLRAGNAQGIEQCFYLAGEQTVNWYFEATADLLVNFHVHPERDGGYYTIYLERMDDVRASEGVFAAEESGAYCFEFGLRQPSTEDIDIQLRFQVE